MFSALFYLQRHSIRNRLRARLRRLKHPKYLIGAIVAALYFGFSFLPLLLIHVKSTAGATPVAVGFGENLGALLLLVVVLMLGWVLTNNRAALAFTETEVAFLFPAPISRRGLIHYKLARSQFAILVSTFFLILLTGRWRFVSHVWIAIIGWWIILSTLNLHMLVASFARSMLFERGITSWRLRALVAVALAVILGGIWQWGAQSWPPLPADQNSAHWLDWAKQALDSGPIPYLLYPFRLVVRPYFAPDALSFFIALGPALAVMALHYFWVMRADVAFEEAAVEYSQKIAERVAAFRARRSSPGIQATKARAAPFRLAPTGSAPVAFLWKNLILARNVFSWRILPFFAGLAVFLGLMVHDAHGAPVGRMLVIGFSVWVLAMSILAGPTMLRADFRADLEMADMLKGYPLPGWKIVLGEILAPMAILTTVQWLLILVAWIGLMAFDGPVTQPQRLGLALGLAILVPAFDLLTLLIMNGMALLFPGWVRLGKNAPGGMENFGQAIVIGLARLLVMFAALLPAGLGFGLVFVVMNFIAGPALAVPAGALTAALVIAGEGAAAIYFLGKAFERFDLSSELSN